MKTITGLLGREDLVAKAIQDVKKGRHVLITGPIGVGKSAILETVVERLQASARLVIYLADHQPKAQFVALARHLLAAGLLDPHELDLPEPYRSQPAASLDWAKLKRPLGRLSMRDLAGAIIPALHDHPGQVLIAVDDLTGVTPTLVAFWLAVFAVAQVIGCASQKKPNLSRLWWKMTELAVTPLPPATVRQLVQTYSARQGMLIEAPELFIEHIVKQAGGNPQAIHDMLTDASKERVVDKRRIRAMQHAAGVRYLDFTPVMMVATAGIVGARYLAMGTGDKALYIVAGMFAAVLVSIRFLLFRGAGKAD